MHYDFYSIKVKDILKFALVIAIISYILVIS